MILGFNTEIESGGRVYHIQTSDKGSKNPVIETLIYQGGEILATRRTPYGDLIKRGYEEKKVIKLMEVQHRRSIFQVKKGTLEEMEPAAAAAAGEVVLDEKALDEVVRDYLASQAGTEGLELVMATGNTFTSGNAVFLRVLASTSYTRKPLAGVRVTAQIRRRSGAVETLYAGKTDEEGEANLMLILPEVREKQTHLLIRGEAPELGQYVLQQEVTPAP
jgi:hypothetical protein